jgi:hypothetical protein
MDRAPPAAFVGTGLEKKALAFDLGELEPIALPDWLFVRPEPGAVEQGTVAAHRTARSNPELWVRPSCQAASGPHDLGPNMIRHAITFGVNPIEASHAP